MARSVLHHFAALIVLWLLLNGSLASDVVWVGATAALIISVAFRDRLAVLSEFRRTPDALVAALGYFLYFSRELVRSNLQLAKVVLSPALPIRPGIVKTRTALKSRMGRVLLANSITLTPGTLSVDLEGEWLYVHWVNMSADDIDGATAAIVSGFESYLERMYG